jgi:hypothetical protein
MNAKLSRQRNLRQHESGPQPLQFLGLHGDRLTHWLSRCQQKFTLGTMTLCVSSELGLETKPLVKGLAGGFLVSRWLPLAVAGP